jgi:glutaredoxin
VAAEGEKPDAAPGGEAVRAMKTVTLYGRAGCHLCDEARTILLRVRAGDPFRLEEIDIESDDALLKRYLERIPVIAVDGEELFDFFVDEEALRRNL